jgi:hypothetical protein
MRFRTEWSSEPAVGGTFAHGDSNCDDIACHHLSVYMSLRSAVLRGAMPTRCVLEASV